MLEDQSKTPWDWLKTVGGVSGLGGLGYISVKVIERIWPRAESRRSADQEFIHTLISRVETLEKDLDDLREGFALQLAQGEARNRREVHHYRGESHRLSLLIALMHSGYAPTHDEEQVRPYDVNSETLGK